MIESDDTIVQTLIAQNDEFKTLYKRHNELKTKVGKAGIGTLAIGDAALSSMKREKLLAKDRMAVMVEDYRRKHEI